uniref:Uncharacterized protein n=1 Tax=Panagrolaimus superbus TaxID=310955 RepID=A0A914Y0X9_9BILA
MEQEFTEDESSEDSIAEILDYTLSGEDLDLDEQIPDASSSSQKPRRSTRTTVISRLNTSNEEEMQPSPDVGVEERFEEQEEWKPPEKPKRRRKAPITRRKRREKSDRLRPLKINTTSLTTGRPRGRPRRFNQGISEMPHSEGQFDIFDEDKTPERDGEFDEFKNFEEMKEDGVDKSQEKIEIEEAMEIEVQEIDLQKNVLEELKKEENLKVEKIPQVVDLEDDEVLIQEEKEEDSDIIFIPDEPDSPKSPIQEYSAEPLPFPPPPFHHPQSVVVYGLEESEEESSVSDSERTISDDDRNFDYNDDIHEQYDPEEIQRPHEETAQGSGAIVIDTIPSHHHMVTIDDEDENTQYSVEAELAQYAREDERNAQL